ncbi:uncharacterized protein LOC102804969, partial [Saccoglossus kowalevskii]
MLTQGSHGTKSIIEILGMYIQCVENSYQRDSQINLNNVKSDLEKAMVLLDEDATSAEQRPSVKYLNNVALIRHAMVFLSEVIHSHIHTQELHSSLSQVIATAQNLIEKMDSMDASVSSAFLLKNICRRYGMYYKNRIRESDQLKGIIPQHLRTTN